jgi:hypothetical protein
MVRTPSDRYGVRAFTGLARPRPIRWWFRTGTWLAVLGITRLVYTVRARWRSMFLAAGALLVIIGVTLSSAGAFVPGLLVLLIGLTGGAESSHCRSADQMTGAHWHA